MPRSAGGADTPGNLQPLCRPCHSRKTARFDGLSLVDQHKLVYAALAEPLSDGTIHELRITTKGS